MRPHKKLLNQYPSHGEDALLFEFVMGEGGGIPRIVRFMNDWAEAFPKTLRHQVVRYEDLRAETTATLASVLTFWARRRIRKPCRRRWTSPPLNA